MAITLDQYPELGLDIQVEVLSAIVKFFPHKGDKFFGQLVVNTALLNEAVIKGLETPNMPFNQRRNLNKAIRRSLKSRGYKTGLFQRKKGEKLNSVSASNCR